MVNKCEICGCELTTKSKYCNECNKARKREYARERYKTMKERGISKKRYGTGICIYCGKEYTINHKGQLGHGECRIKHSHKTVDNYNSVKRSNKGNTIGRQIILDLGFEISPDMVVHHMDENPDNNQLSNLIILNRSYHAKLHRILEKNWSLFLKENNSNLENCWNILRGQLTTAYLEMNSANVLKITDIGQSAAEPLNDNIIYIFSQEEGSETMYQVPKLD